MGVLIFKFIDTPLYRLQKEVHLAMKQKLLLGKPLFENVFGTNNTIKVLDFFFLGQNFDFTITQIHKGTGLSRTAVRNAIEELLDKSLIAQTREDDKSKYFQINKKNNKYSLLHLIYKRISQDVINS